MAIELGVGKTVEKWDAGIVLNLWDANVSKRLQIPIGNQCQAIIPNHMLYSLEIFFRPPLRVPLHAPIYTKRSAQDIISEHKGTWKFWKVMISLKKIWRALFPLVLSEMMGHAAEIVRTEKENEPFWFLAAPFHAVPMSSFWLLRRILLVSYPMYPQYL